MLPIHLASIIFEYCELSTLMKCCTVSKLWYDEINFICKTRSMQYSDCSWYYLDFRTLFSRINVMDEKLTFMTTKNHGRLFIIGKYDVRVLFTYVPIEMEPVICNPQEINRININDKNNKNLYNCMKYYRKQYINRIKSLYQQQNITISKFMPKFIMTDDDKKAIKKYNHDHSVFVPVTILPDESFARASREAYNEYVKSENKRLKDNSHS